jgi:hypothetical protein
MVHLVLLALEEPSTMCVLYNSHSLSSDAFVADLRSNWLLLVLLWLLR